MKNGLSKTLAGVVTFALAITIIPGALEVATPKKSTEASASGLAIDGGFSVPAPAVIGGTSERPADYQQRATGSASLPANQKAHFTKCSGRGACSGSRTATSIIVTQECRSTLKYSGGIVVNNPGSGNISGMQSWFWDQPIDFKDPVGAFMRWFTNGGAAVTMWWHFFNGNTGDIAAGAWEYKSCAKLSKTRLESDRKSKSCAVQPGRNFPYPVSIYWLKQTDKSGRAGTDDFGNSYPRTSKEKWVGGTPRCVYVDNGTQIKQYLLRTETCIWNVKYSASYARTKGAIQNGGSSVPTRPRPGMGDNNVAPSVSKSGGVPTLNNCTKNINWGVAAKTPDYGYYRIAANITVRDYHTYYWDPAWTGGAQVRSNIVAGPVRHGQNAYAYGVYSCSVDNGRFRFVGQNYGSLPGSITLDSAKCRESIGNPQWECIMNPRPNVNATGGPGSPAYVMRDGRNNRLKLPLVTLQGNVRDVDTKSHQISGQNSSYRTNVPANVSPRKSAGNNDAKQYFKMTQADGKTKENFGSWRKDPNGNRDKNLAFYWSSDQNKSWMMTYESKIDVGEYQVPRVGWSDESPRLEWIRGELGLCNLPGDRKALVANSNQVVVERSTQSG